MNWLNWFNPGMGVKRWLLVVFAGLFIATQGIILANDARLIRAMEKIISSLAADHLDSGYRILAGVLMLLAGLGLAYIGMGRLLRNIFQVLLPEKSGVGEEMLLRCQLRRGPKVVALGGGTGLSTLLRGLKELTSNLTAIVTVTDDGGSSGRLRGDLGIPAPGDIRNCLVALADREKAMEDLFNYRFADDSSLAGHSLGNLLIAGLTQTSGDFAAAVQQSSRVLAVRGQVLPVTVDGVNLKAEMSDGRFLTGETTITAARGKINRVILDPPDCRPLPAAVEAIMDAEVILLGPGSLYTSVIPNLLVPGIIPAIRRSRATVYYICNIMTQPGETDGYAVSDHVQAIIDHCGEGIIDTVIVNSDQISKKLRRRYAAQGAEPVLLDGAMAELPVDVLAESLSSQLDFARHDAGKLVNMLAMEIQTSGSGLFRRLKRSNRRRRS